VEYAPSRRRRRALLALRAGLVVFVLAWIFGWLGLQSLVPIWLPFLVALGLEVHFFASARRAGPPRRDRPDRLPQAADRERYGTGDTGELLLVRRDGEELWIPYAGETGDDLDALVAEAREQAEREAGETPASPVPAPPPQRSPAQLLAGVGVIAALALAVWVAGGRGGWQGLDAEARAEAAALYSAEASRIVGRPVTIHCDEAGDHVGAVQHADGAAVVGGSVAWLTPERCYDLYRLAFRDEVSFSQTARSLAVLAHEAWHLRGLRHEGTTECYALQSGVELGRRLGLTEQTARQMMRQQLAENALRARTNPGYLVPPGCRAGGDLDLDPESSSFP
jgi:hypothetical protein